MSIFDRRRKPAEPARLPAPELSTAWRPDQAMASVTQPPVPAQHLSTQEDPEIALRDGYEAEDTPPPGVLGYVVVLRGDSGLVLTDSSLKSKSAAEAERRSWGNRVGWMSRAVVCEVRTAGEER